MKIKVIILALVISLLAGLVVPVVASGSASANGGTNSLGPMMIGIQTTGNNFDGIGATIQLGGDGTLKLANIKGLSLNGCFRLSLTYDAKPAPGGQGAITGGVLCKRLGLLSLFSSYSLPLGSPITGAYFDLEQVVPSLRGNYMILFYSFGNAQEAWGGLLFGDIVSLTTVLPQALVAMGGPDISCLMPTLQKLVKMINPFMQKHPLILMMPLEQMSTYLMPIMFPPPAP